MAAASLSRRQRQVAEFNRPMIALQQNRPRSPSSPSSAPPVDSGSGMVLPVDDALAVQLDRPPRGPQSVTRASAIPRASWAALTAGVKKP